MKHKSRSRLTFFVHTRRRRGAVDVKKNSLRPRRQAAQDVHRGRGLAHGAFRLPRAVRTIVLGDQGKRPTRNPGRGRARAAKRDSRETGRERVRECLQKTTPQCTMQSATSRVSNLLNLLLQASQSPSPSSSISFSKLLNLLLQASQSPTPISFSFPKTTSRRFRQPHARVAVVEHGVVRSDEHVA